jgi:hypothetical protein
MAEDVVDLDVLTMAEAADEEVTNFDPVEVASINFTVQVLMEAVAAVEVDSTVVEVVDAVEAPTPTWARWGPCSR